MSIREENLKTKYKKTKMFFFWKKGFYGSTIVQAVEVKLLGIFLQNVHGGLASFVRQKVQLLRVNGRIIKRGRGVIYKALESRFKAQITPDSQ